MGHFIPKTKLSESEIMQGVSAGTLQAWRVDGNGVQWFKRTPPMHGIPAQREPEEYSTFEGDDDDAQ